MRKISGLGRFREVRKHKKIWYSEKYGWVFPGKYLVLGLLGIIGLAFVENQFLFFILVIYLIGCIIGFFKGDS